MEEAIDLQPYVVTLVKKWYWIVGAAILAGIIAFTVSTFLPPTYEATALVVVVEPENILQFDERIRQLNEPQPLSAFPQLAMSDGLLQNLLTQEVIDNISTVEELRLLLDARPGEDRSVIQLTVISESKTDAANLANAWANLFVIWVNNIYGSSNQEQVSFFEARLEDAEVDLFEAETALITYQSVNEQLLVDNVLQSATEKQTTYLAAQQTVERLLRDVETLINQLSVQETSNSVNLADQLTAFQLQFQTYSPPPISELNSSTPLLQISMDAEVVLTSSNRDDQIALLENLHTTLVSQSAQIEEELEAIEPDILRLQQQKQEAETHYNRLLRDQIVAEETYTVLARKVEEERITSQDTRSGVKLASEATVPERPLSRNRLIITVIAGIFASTIVSFMILGTTWWKTTNETSPESER